MSFHQIGTLTRPSRSVANFGLGVATIEVTLLARPTESGVVVKPVNHRREAGGALAEGELRPSESEAALVNRKLAGQRSRCTCTGDKKRHTVKRDSDT